MPHLHINVDHVATVRQARKTTEPDPVYAALLAEQAGAQGITMHLREDRRHIQDRDVRLMKQMGQTPLNLEMAVTDEMVQFALELLPPLICLVPEKRQEVTTEGGLDVVGNFVSVQRAVQALQGAGMEVSLFIGPVFEQIKAAIETGAKAIELHTGEYAHAADPAGQRLQLDRLAQGVQWGREGGLKVNAGHGLTYFNIGPIAALKGLSELNIGHSIISRSLYVGMPQAVREMRALIETHAKA